MQNHQTRQVVGSGFFEQIDPRLNQVDEAAVNAYVVKVFGWMFFGLLITALSTAAIIVGINTSPAFAALVANLIYTNAIFVVFLLQLGLVFAISARATKMNPQATKMMYFLYAAVNGLTVGLISVLFAASIGENVLFMAFGLTAASFGAMALYGYFTGRDLTRFSSLLRFALIGLILIIVVNWFVGSDAFSYLISIVGLFLFLGLTAADTNKIKNHFARVALGSTDASNQAMGVTVSQDALASNLAIVGALMLYLDFINIFMFILRLLGGRR